MSGTTVYLWKKAPVLRLFVPLVAGIVMQWYIPLSLLLIITAALISLLIVVAYSFLSVAQKWKWSSVNGMAISILFVSAGAWLVYANDIRHQQNWIGRKAADAYIVTLQEPLVEKPNSYKAIAQVETINHQHRQAYATGNIIIYFKKDTSLPALNYGSQIIFTRPLQPIKNTGNPGGFNYRQYCLFQDITHQVYLTEKDFVVLPQKNANAVKQFIFNTRNAIVHIIRTYIKGDKEKGLAEALLIGYKDDLDKNLVQSYSNTGVVHIIAISGLHVGLIYWLLLLLTKPLKRRKGFHALRMLAIIAGLWLFGILAGGQPSVMRSVVMFTFIALAEVFDRRTSVYNTLILSAFLLLCYDPFWWWDVGFQLSYAAVLGILIFFRPVYNWLYFKNKAVDFVWKLNAVTMAAQIFTVPLSLYYFHQFPNLFLLTNLVAVPLSSMVLLGEIGVCAISFLPVVAQPLGSAVSFSIKLMNDYIERLEQVSFALWNGIYISLPQTILLMAAIGGAGFWLMEQKKKALLFALTCMLLFTIFRTLSFMQANAQQKLIVYNVPRHQAIDIVQGRKYFFVGDSSLLYDDFLRNFHLQPSRIMHRTTPACTTIAAHSFQLNNKRIVVIDTAISFGNMPLKAKADVVILSKSPKLYISSLNDMFFIGQIVIDGSVPAWKARQWKEDCNSLHIPYHDVAEKGAFVMNL